MICPNCNQEAKEDSVICEFCGFDIALYNETYQRIYQEKINKLNREEREKDKPKITYISSPEPISCSDNNSVHKPRCPFCNSENLTKITTAERAINAAMFGLLGNKRKYQWHCNNCKSNW